MKIGVVGTGNLASAVISGSVSSGKLKGSDFTLYDIFPQKVEENKIKFGTNSADSANEIARSCDVVILSVKPKDFAALLESLASDFEKNNPLILSVAAGLTVDYIASFLPYKAKIARIMTNINASIGGAMTAYCTNDSVSEEEAEFLDFFCKLFGDAIKLDESLFPQFSVLAGCVPAFAYKFVDELARAGVKIGVSKNLALRIAAQTVLGSAKAVLSSDAHPYELIDRVCTPAGTTIDGISALMENGFENAVMKAVESSYNKDKALKK